MAFGPVNVVPPINADDVIDQGQIGKPGGLASLDENGKLPAEQIPEISFDKLGLPLDFNNLLHWPGCTRITSPTNDATGETVEHIVDTATKKILKAKRTTLKNSDGSYQETYVYYEDDGTTEKYRFVVRTTKDGTTSSWYEEVTKEEVSNV